MSKSTPATPDYAGAAVEQGQQNADVIQSQTYANRANVDTPWSQQTWANQPVWDPTTGQYVNQWTQNTNLTPQAQGSLDAQLGAQQNLSQDAQTLSQNPSLTQGLNTSGFTNYGQVPTTPDYTQTGISTDGLPAVNSSNAYANSAAAAAYSQYTARNQPQQQLATQRLDTQLQNQGLKPGDAAYDTAMTQLQNQQSFANTDASNAATLTGVNAGATMQGEDLANNANQFSQRAQQGTFTNSAANQVYQQGLLSDSASDSQRSQQLSEQLQEQGFNVNQIEALLNGQQVTTGPSTGYNAAGSATPTNLMQALQSQYGASLNSTNAQNANNSNLIAGAGALAALL